MALTYREVRMVDYSDFEKLVQDTYGRPDYEFDHECYMSNGSIQYFSVPGKYLTDYDREEFQSWLANKPDPTDLSPEDQERVEFYLSMYDGEIAKFEQDPEPYLQQLKPGGGGSLLLKEDGTPRSREEYRQYFVDSSHRYGPSVRTECPLDALAQDLFEKGLIEAGSYAVEKSW